MNAQFVNVSEFSETVRNSVSVIKHVYEQSNALGDILDQKIPGQLRPVGIGCVVPDLRESYQMDANESICTAWMRRYDLTLLNSGRGKKPRLGYLYMLIRIAPSPGATVDQFVPYLAAFVDHRECGTASTGGGEIEGTSLDRWLGYAQLDLPGMPTEKLCVADYYDKDDLADSGAAMFIPLGAINNNNVDTTVVGPAVRLIEHCRREWFPEARTGVSSGQLC